MVAVIRVHIGRLVLDGPVADTDVLLDAVRRELSRLLVPDAAAASAAASVRGGAVPGLRGPDITEPSSDAAVLGAQIAAAVHAAVRAVHAGPTGADRSDGQGAHAAPGATAGEAGGSR